MTNKLEKIAVPRGTKDILPLEIERWVEVENTSRKILKCFGFKEIRTPFFEETGLFKRSLGQTSDVVAKQLLELASQKEEGYSLRPEGTASVVRSYIENNLDKIESLSKLFYIGAMFRGERPQKGRFRQFHQIGVEAIGPNSSVPYLDAEIIALCTQLLQAFGLSNFTVHLNTLGTHQDKGNFAKLLHKQLKSQLLSLCENCQDRFERNVLRILDCKNRECKSVVDKLDIGHSYLSPESKDYFAKVEGALSSLNVAYVISPQLVRGLDYYTHTVFEITHAGLGSQDALGAGGRYNDLVSQLGGPQVDAMGFALGVERILLALPDKPQMEKFLDLFMIALDEASFHKAYQLLNALRLNGVCGDISFRITSLKNQMRQADKTKARYTMILGEDELKKWVVTLKDMNTGQQTQLAMGDISKMTTVLLER